MRAKKREVLPPADVDLFLHLLSSINSGILVFKQKIEGFKNKNVYIL
jgi:hypothetical protein